MEVIVEVASRRESVVARKDVGVFFVFGVDSRLRYVFVKDLAHLQVCEAERVQREVGLQEEEGQVGEEMAVVCLVELRWVGVHRPRVI